MKRTGSAEMARELTQQAFIKLWRSRNSLSDSFDLDAQCFTISGSVLIDHLRKRATERKIISDQLIEEDAELPCSGGELDFETTDFINHAAGTLPAIRKHVFLLKITKGYTNKEVAERLSISVKTVEDHYSKAVRQLRAAGTYSSMVILPPALAGLLC